MIIEAAEWRRRRSVNEKDRHQYELRKYKLRRVLPQPRSVSEAAEFGPTRGAPGTRPRCVLARRGDAERAEFNQYGGIIPRDDEMLVQVVEELGTGANGHCAEFKVVNVPSDVEWEIEKVGGVEHVSEVHRTWS